MKTNKTPRDLQCLQINLAASQTSLSTLQLALDKSGAQVCAISDPPIRCNRSAFPNYHLISTMEQDSKALLLVHKSIKFRHVGPPSTRVSSVIITTSIGSVAITSFYIQPQTAEGLNDLAQHLEHLRKHTSLILLLGDSNGHSPLWSPASSNSQGQKIEDLIYSNGLVVLNNPEALLHSTPEMDVQAPGLTYHLPLLLYPNTSNLGHCYQISSPQVITLLLLLPSTSSWTPKL